MTTQTTTARPLVTDQSQPQSAGRAGPSRAALLVAMLGFFVVALDAQIVNVALPDIRTSLGGGLSGLQWVVTGYTLMFSALQLFAGTFADRITARRAYGTGMVLFVLASAAAGFAPTLRVLVASRIVQGVGAALITPTSLALVREAFDDAAARGRAIAYWALGGSVAAATGPVLGGLLTQVDWRLIFFVNLPVGAIALTLLTRVAPSTPRPSRFDWTGQVAAVTAMAALTYGVIEGTASVLLALVLAAVAGVVFIAAQARGRNPCFPWTCSGHRSCRPPWSSRSSPWPRSTGWCSCSRCTSSSCAAPAP
jgi:DHA2 family methylenomycin A resistance protein-like MFS transporter